MATFLRKLFGKPPRLEQLAHNADRAAFVRQLQATDIFVFAALASDGLDPFTMTKEAALAEIERAVKDLDERQDGFEPFIYEREGRRCLPFFTSDAYAQAFVGEYSKEHNRVYPFQMLGVKGSVLGQLLPACDVVVMNDRDPQEVVLTLTDLAAMENG